jgi:hypothetical protein
MSRLKRSQELRKKLKKQAKEEKRRLKAVSQLIYFFQKSIFGRILSSKFDFWVNFEIKIDLWVNFFWLKNRFLNSKLTPKSIFEPF